MLGFAFRLCANLIFVTKVLIRKTFRQFTGQPALTNLKT